MKTLCTLIVFLFISCTLCSCSTVRIKYGGVEITSSRLFEDQNLEGLNIVTADGVIVSIDKKTNLTQTEIFSEIIGAAINAAIPVP